MPEQLSPGVTFSEPRVTPAEIASASTSIGGMVGIAERGPINDPVLIGSFEEYVKIFGSYYLSSPLPGSVKAFFDNGGRALYVNRAGPYTDLAAGTLDVTTTKASRQLQGTGPANTALIRATSHGGHGNALTLTTLRVDTQIATVATTIPFSAVTEATISDIRRVYIGATLRFVDGANNMRVIVTRVDVGLKKVFFASNTPATGAVTAPAGIVNLEEWQITVKRDGRFNETIANLAMATTSGKYYFKERINNGDPVRQIEVQTDNALVASNTVDPRPLDITDQPMGAGPAGFIVGADGGGVVDADLVGVQASKTGLYAFDVIDDVNILSVPGKPTATVHLGLITYVERDGLLFGVMAVNEGQTPAQAKTYVTVTANLYSEYAAIYYPWVKIADGETGLLKSFTPEGYVMGVYSRTDSTRGVQKAPAGTPDGRLANVLGPERVLTRADLDSLYPANINPIVSFPGKGTVLWGSRTLSSSEFRQINVRRVFNFTKLSLKNGTLHIVFEENNSNTRAQVRKTVGAFLIRLWRRGILKGKNAKEAFFIICDESNNPPSVELAGKLLCRIGLSVSRPAEFVEFELVQDTRALDAELAAAGI